MGSANTRHMAVAPNLYAEGIIRLVPLAKRGRAHEILQALGHTLRWWLLGRGVSMLMVGLFTAAGLWLIAVPLALTFGLLAALLTFVPYLGPVLSAIPPTFLALTQQPRQALYVILLYIGIQGVESYLLTPLVQESTVSLPPALTSLHRCYWASCLGLWALSSPPRSSSPRWC
jgi:predicted PurR-regulated permease PerM